MSPEVTVGQVLLAVGEVVGFANIMSASRMKKAVVVFVKEKSLVDQLTEHGITVSGEHFLFSLQASVTGRVTISNVPPSVANEDRA